MSKLSYARRVRNGYNLLNKHFGHKNWIRDIDLDTLDLGEPDLCICGQAFGGTGIASGFGIDICSEDNGFIYGVKASHERLKDEWRKFLLPLQEKLAEETLRVKLEIAADGGGSVTLSEFEASTILSLIKESSNGKA